MIDLNFRYNEDYLPPVKMPDKAGRDAHLSGRVAEALMAKADELLSNPPEILKVDVLAAKLPAS